MMRHSLKLSVALTGMMTLSVAGHQDTCIWEGTCTAWDNPDSWSCGHVPGSEDDVIIQALSSPAGCYPDVNADTTIRSLTVKNGGLLYFYNAGYTLTVTGGDVNIQNGGEINIIHTNGKLVVSDEDGLDIDAGGVLKISGELELKATSTTTGHDIDGQILLQHMVALIDIQESMFFIGDGKVEGQNVGANITVASGKTLSNKMSDTSGNGFRGFMTIDGAGTFSNQGRVEAKGGVLHINCGAVADVASAGFWVVSGDDNSELKFSTAATSLSGDFILSRKLQAVANVQTCGGLTYNIGASITVDGNTFKYQDFDGGTCTAGNPADSGTGADCTDNIFVVSTNKSACTV